MCEHRTPKTTNAGASGVPDLRTGLGLQAASQFTPSAFTKQSTFGCFEWELSSGGLVLSENALWLHGFTPSDLQTDEQKEPSIRAIKNSIIPIGHDLDLLIVECIRNGGSLQHVRTDGARDGKSLHYDIQLICDHDGTPLRLIGACRYEPLVEPNGSEWQVAGLQLLADLSAEMLSQDISSASIENTFRQLASHLDCDIFTNFRVDGDQLRLVTSLGLPPEINEALRVIEFGQQMCGICAQRDEVLHADSGELETHPQAAALWQIGVRAYVAAPIRSNGKLIGTLAFASKARECFGENEIDFVRNVASLIAAFKAKHTSDTELREAETRQQIVLSAVKTVVWESDPACHQFSFVGGPFEDLLGFSHERWLEPGFWKSRVHPEDVESAIAYCQAHTKLHRDHRFEYRMIHENGQIVWVEDFVNVLVVNEQVRSLRGVLVNITERKQLETELRQSQKMQAIGRLAGGIAHDFNNVLTVISTYAELMLGRLTEQDPNQGPVKAIREASERAAALTSQLLVFSRKSISEPRVLKLNEVVRGSEKLLNRVLGEDIFLKTDLSDEIGGIKIDQSQFEQVILNLAINARDSMPDGGSLILATREFVVEHDSIGLEHLVPGRYVELTVTDTGCGMGDETLERCFEPFYSTKPVGAGTGLGLSVTYGVIKDAGGHIRAKSKVGVGTEFNILIPVTDWKDEDVRKHEPVVRVPTASGRVLLVEDEASVRKVARMTLEMCGYDVTEADSGAEALELAETMAENFDMLVTDLVMPGMNGRELATRLKTRYEDLGVLFISGYGDTEVAHRLANQPDVFLLSKPFTANGLMEAAHEVMTSKRTQVSNLKR